MIKPDRYTDPVTCVMNVCATLLSQLQEHKALTITEANVKVVSDLGEEATYNLMPAISLIFLLGCVAYDEAADALVYLPEPTK